MWFIFLLMFFPIIFDPLQVGQVLLCHLSEFSLNIFILLREGEELIEVLLQLFQIIDIFDLLHGFNLVLIVCIHALDFLLPKGRQFCKLRLAVVLCLHVSVECRIAEIGFTAVAREVPAVLIVSCPSLALQLIVIHIELLPLGGQIGFTHSRKLQYKNQNNFELKTVLTMLCFLGVKLDQPITNKQKYKQCLQQIKHYLSLKKLEKKIEIQESDYILSVINQNYTFSLVKNPLYFHSNYYNMPLMHSEDYQFLEICYECLMIIEQTFPLNIKIELVTDSQSRELTTFQENKREELNRRINNNLRAIAESTAQLEIQDIQNTIFLISHSYWRKNKLIALKMLINKATNANASELSEEFIQYIDKLQEEPELKKLAVELGNKIKNIQSESLKNNENVMKMSNLSNEKYGDTLKLQPLIFQLKQSYNLERVCALLTNALSSQQEKDNIVKLQSSINIITNKFLSNQFEEAARFASQFTQLLKQYWTKRGKRWQETIRTSVENKARELTSISRVNTNKSRLITSRKAS